MAGDIIGPLPRTSKGFEYIEVFQDLFSRWAEASPIRKANAKAVVGELDRKVFLRFGSPEVFLSDNGTEFKNRAGEDFLKERGVHNTNTPTYHPQANPVERANRTLKTMVASYLKEPHNTWDEKLPELLFAMNTAVHSSTRISPAMLLYGRQPEPLAGSVGCKRLRPRHRPKMKVWLAGRSGWTPFQTYISEPRLRRVRLKIVRPVTTMRVGESQTSSQETGFGNAATHSHQNSKGRIGLRRC